MHIVIRHVIIKPENKYSNQNPAYCFALKHSHRTNSPGLPSGSLPAPRYPAAGHFWSLSGVHHSGVMSDGKVFLWQSSQNPPVAHSSPHSYCGKGKATQNRTGLLHRHRAVCHPAACNQPSIPQPTSPAEQQRTFSSVKTEIGNETNDGKKKHMLLSEEATTLPLKSGMDCISELIDNGITVLCLSWFCKECQRPTVL